MCLDAQFLERKKSEPVWVLPGRRSIDDRWSMCDSAFPADAVLPLAHKEGARRARGARIWKSRAGVEVRLRAGKLLYTKPEGNAGLEEEEFTAEFRSVVAALGKGLKGQGGTEWAARGVGERRQGLCSETYEWGEYEVLVRFPRQLKFEQSLARLALPGSGWAVKALGAFPRECIWKTWFSLQLDGWERDRSATDVCRGGRIFCGRECLQMFPALGGANTECSFSEENMQRMLSAEYCVEKQGEMGILMMPVGSGLFICSLCRNKGHRRHYCPAK
jgi:hypothetical protein